LKATSVINWSPFQIATGVEDVSQQLMFLGGDRIQPT